MTYSVRDSRTPEIVEAVFPDVKDAIAAAIRSGLDVYVHSEICPPELPLGRDCPCRPAWIPARPRSLGRELVRL